MRGKFIVLDGIDGSGTTTQAGQLLERLNTCGIAAVRTREPSDGEIGRMLRDIMRRPVTDSQPRKSNETMALLFTADRADHQREIEEQLAAGVSVICDRYVLSTIAYQTESAPEGERAAFQEYVTALNQRFIQPDITLLVDLAAEDADRRIAKRGNVRELFEVPELQGRLRRKYLELSHMFDNVVVLDGSQSPESVGDAIWSQVFGLYNEFVVEAG